MYFINFLEFPRIEHEGDPFQSWIRGSVSIVTHPDDPNGVKHLDQNLTLVASLVSSNDGDTPCLADSYEWKAETSALPIFFDITNINVIWPVKIMVFAENQTTGNLAISKATSIVCAARSDLIHPPYGSHTIAKVERQLMLSNERLLRFWEDFDLDPAQQLRYETQHIHSTY